MADEKNVNVEQTSESGKAKAKAGKMYWIQKRKSKDGQWEVVIRGGLKPVKLFETQKEAIDFCEDLCKNQGARYQVRASKGAKAGKLGKHVDIEE